MEVDRQKLKIVLNEINKIVKLRGNGTGIKNEINNLLKKHGFDTENKYIWNRINKYYLNKNKRSKNGQ